MGERRRLQLGSTRGILKSQTMESAIRLDFRMLKSSEAKSHGFRILFTVDVVAEDALQEVTDVVNNFLQADSGVHDSFIKSCRLSLGERMCLFLQSSVNCNLK